MILVTIVFSSLTFSTAFADSTLLFESTFGSAGTGNGQFSGINDVTTNSTDFTFVLDGNNQHVQIFDPSGNYVSQLSSPGNVNGQFISPSDITASNTDLIFITDVGNNRIQVFDPSGNFEFLFNSPGTGNGQFTSLSGITTNSTDFVLVTGSNGAEQRVQVFSIASLPTIKITKNAIGGDGAFDFTIFNATNPANSTIVSIPNTAISNMTVPLEVQPGNYTVIEIIPIEWELTGSDCEKNGFSLGTITNFTIVGNDVVECIFENTKFSNPTIKITKNATNADGAFDFTIFNATNPTNSTIVNIANTAISNMTVPLSVLPGNYSVSETVLASWILDSADCEKNGFSLGTILKFNVTLGDSVECIFENTKILLQTLNSTKDSFLRSGNSNTNEGVNPNMVVRASGNNRALVSFNVTDFTGPIDNATLRLFIVHNANNWGPLMDVQLTYIE